MEWKHTDSPVKKKRFQVQWSVKKVMLTVFWDMKGRITIDFLEKKLNEKQCFLLQTPKVKFILLIEWFFVY